MKSGDPTPKEARILIRKLAASTPRLTNKAIRERVKRKLAVDLSYRTIRRICENAGLPTSIKPIAVIPQQLASQMELSGHWPNLRRTAGELTGQLSVPLSQLLGFSFSPRNEKLRITPERGKVTASHSIEEETLFLGLRKHLPTDKAWPLLNRWKRTVGDITNSLDYLCSRATREVRGHRWLNEVDLDSEEGGLTDYFAKSLVLEAVEDACGLPRNGYDWEISALNAKRKSWLLRWVRNGSSFVPIAVGPDGPALDGIKELHHDILVRIQSLEETQAIRAEWLELEGIITALAKELDRIANLALFPKNCILCSGR